MKSLLLFISLFVLDLTSNWKTLHIEHFTIETPRSWRYVKRNGVDSFVGEIKGPNVLLEFDYSHLGYAGLRVQEPTYFIHSKIQSEYSKLFNKPGVRYFDSAALQFRRAEYFKATGRQLSEKFGVTIRPIFRIYEPSKTDLEKYPGADYLVDLTHQDSTITVAVKLPEETRHHNFKIDTTAKYIITYVWPKRTDQGLTGVWFRSRKSRFTFSLKGDNLRIKQQDLALQAFSTIRIEEN